MLTDTKLKALRPRVELYRVADEKGLCIEVHPGGALLAPALQLRRQGLRC